MRAILRTLTLVVVFSATCAGVAEAQAGFGGRTSGGFGAFKPGGLGAASPQPGYKPPTYGQTPGATPRRAPYESSIRPIEPMKPLSPKADDEPFKPYKGYDAKSATPKGYDSQKPKFKF